MFCKSCGKEIPDGILFCDACGAAVDASVAVQPQVENMVQDEPVITLNTQGQSVAPKKKWLIPALICAGVLVVAAVVLAIFLLRPTGGGNQKADSTPEEKNAQAGQENLNNMVDSVGDNLNEWLEKPSGSYGYEGQVCIVIDETIMSMLSTEMDMQWLSEIAFNYYLSSADNMTLAKVQLALRDTEITSAQYILDKESMDAWIEIPDISQQALYFNLLQQMEDSGVDMSVLMSDSFDSITADDLKEVFMPYIELALNSFDQVAEVEETVEIDGVSQNLTVLKAEMTEETFYRVLLEILEGLKTDEKFADLIGEIEQIYGEDVEFYDSLMISLDDAIASVQEQQSLFDPSANNVMYLHTYLNDQDETVGILLGTTDEGEVQDAIYFLQVEDGNEIANEFRLGEELRVIGSGEDSGTFSGTYTVYVQNEKYLKVELKNYDMDADFATGTIRITPQKAFMDALAESMEMDESTKSMMSMLSFVIEIKISGDANDNKTSISLSASGMKFVTIDITGKVTSAMPITVPTDVVDAMDEEALAQWAESLDEEAFTELIIQRLVEAGMPEELLLMMGYAGAEIPV